MDRTARGLRLRYLLVVAIIDASGPLTVAQLVAAVRAAGYEVPGRPGKTISDALRWEVARGRVLRLRRGTYTLGYVAKGTRSRMRRRVAMT